MVPDALPPERMVEVPAPDGDAVARPDSRSPGGDVTRILAQAAEGSVWTAGELLPLVYHELRRVARQRLAGERPGQTLQPTALVHEAYLRLLGSDERAPQWNSRNHFFVAAAEAMRRILVENARRKATARRGGNYCRQHVDLERLPLPQADDEVLAVNDALGKLASERPAVAKLVELRYFGGLTLEEAAALLEVSPRTAHRYWAYARAWLHSELARTRRSPVRDGA